MWYLIVSIPDLCNLTYFDMLSADEKLSALFDKLSQVERKVDCVAPLTKRVVNVENVISSHEHRLQLLEYKSIDIESRSRRRNLIFRGMSEKPEEAKEGSIPTIRHFIYVHLGIQDDMYIERAHRLGRYKQGACRPIVVAFRDYQDTDTIMSNCRKLKGTFFSVNRDYPAEIVEARKALYPMYKEFRDQNRYKLSLYHNCLVPCFHVMNILYCYIFVCSSWANRPFANKIILSYLI